MPSPFPGMDPYLEAPSLWPDVVLVSRPVREPGRVSVAAAAAETATVKADTPVRVLSCTLSPCIGVPLREPDPDVVLNLQAVFVRCYDNGGYADFLDYRPPPPISLSDKNSTWLEELLKERSLR